MKHTGLAEKKSRSNGSSPKKRPSRQFVVCINNQGYPASLEPRKIYSLLADKTAGKSNLIRVIDESGEDYLYPADYFVVIKLSRAVEKAVQLAS